MSAPECVQCRDWGKYERHEDHALPPPCPECGGVTAHITDSCPIYRHMARVTH
jgi:Zn finger protein HypA/HybF involved in hydrogenase expression